MESNVDETDTVNGTKVKQYELERERERELSMVVVST